MCITNINITYYPEDGEYTFGRFKIESVGGRSWHIGNNEDTLTDNIINASKEHCRKFGIEGAVDNIISYNYTLEEEIFIGLSGELQVTLLTLKENKYHVIYVDVDAEEQLDISSVFQTKQKAMARIYEWFGV